MKRKDENGKKIDVEFLEDSENVPANSNADNMQATAEGDRSNAKRETDTKEAEVKSEELTAEDYQKRIRELEEQILRLKAEFVNYKKRVEKEQLEFADYIKGEMFKKLLPVLDDFKMMTEKAEAGQNEQSILEGAKMIYEKLKQILTNEGLEKIESLGQRFDPEVHEALIMKPIEEKHKHEHVVEVFQEGYKLKERLLRPSKVIVGKFEDKKSSNNE